MIAPRYRKPPKSRGGKGNGVCSKCPSNNTCIELNKYELPVECESIWDTDVAHIERQPTEVLMRTGFANRVQLWDNVIWTKYREAV